MIDARRLNAAEMYVDVERTSAATHTQWTAESGVLDLFLLLGPSPRQVSFPMGAAYRTCLGKRPEHAPSYMLLRSC